MWGFPPHRQQRSAVLVVHREGRLAADQPREYLELRQDTWPGSPPTRCALRASPLHSVDAANVNAIPGTSRWSKLENSGAFLTSDRQMSAWHLPVSSLKRPTTPRYPESGVLRLPSISPLSFSLHKRNDWREGER